jgi:hypothetical protein
MEVNMPFTIEQFLDVFQRYNLSVWPMQIILNFIAVSALVLAIKKLKISDKIISSILGFFWLWIGVVYHLIFFTAINTAAYIFGILFIIQGIIFIVEGTIREKLYFQFRFDIYNYSGVLFLTYALMIYPIIGFLLGHVYPRQPTFGLPCPTTIFTFGMLLWTTKRIPKYILIIPFLWSIIGFAAAFNLTIKEDYGLLIAGVLGLLLLLIRDRKSHINQEE